MLNNKGLVVSSVLYTLLIAFLLFLGVTLAQFSSSTKLISNSTKDLVNGYEFKGEMVYETYSKNVFKDYDESLDKSLLYNNFSGGAGPVCGTHYSWNQKLEKNEYGQVVSTNVVDSNTLVRIYSRYGTTFWPRDFKDVETTEKNVESLTNKLKILKCEIDGSNIGCEKSNIIYWANANKDIDMTIEDTATGIKTVVTVYKTC